ncbi:MAG: hypothetical protein KGZ32_00245 [Dethiobacter sp.]|nr:hypothetical protein [Dethiobacter sp.]
MKKLILCVLVCVTIVLSGALILAQSQENIDGYMNRDGTLVQYTTWRTTTTTGQVRLNLNNNTANVTRLGLRNRAGVQFTNTEQWDSLGWRNFHLSSTGSSTIPQGTRFAFNGRMNSVTWPWADNYWAGTLTF